MKNEPTDALIQVDKAVAKSRRLREAANAAREAARRAYEAVHRFYGPERRKRHRSGSSEGWAAPNRSGET